MAYECVLLKTAFKFLDERVNTQERKHIVEILDRICDDPLVDGITKFYFPVPPAIFTIYKEANWWILYYSPRESVLRIVNIGRVSDRPSIRRPP